MDKILNLDTVSFEKDEYNNSYINVKNNLAEAKISLKGAHVISYNLIGQNEVLWLSKKSYTEIDKPIRGGIPICWPYFGGHPSDESMPSHGFARISQWKLINAENMFNGATQLTFLLTTKDVDTKYNPQDFELYYQVTVGSNLECILTARNCGNIDLEISCALHSYFSIGDIDKINISGLEGIPFVDTLDFSDHISYNSISIDREVDRVYYDNNQTTYINDCVLNRKIMVEKFNSYSTVVWNPWIDKSIRMPDFGDDEYKNMVCVESCNCRNDSRILAPNQLYSLGCKISALGF